MIAVDTNVLLRRLLDDEPGEAERARRLFARHAHVLIPDIVLAEAVWTLTGKRYRASRDDIIAAITALLADTKVVFESRKVVWGALNDYATAALSQTTDGTRFVDFTDALIARKAMFTAELMEMPYVATYTFDQAALGLAGTKHP